MATTLSAATRAIGNWIDGPASLISERWDALRPGDRVVAGIAEDGRSLSITAQGRNATAPVPVSLAADQAQAARAAIAPMLAERSVTLVVPRSWVLERRVELPLEAASHVDGIVASRVSTLSPVEVRDTLFGHRVLGVDRTTRKLAVGIVILPRARIAPTLEFLDGAGWRELTIDAPFGESGSITLHPGRSGTVSARHRVKTVLSAMLGTGAVAALLALIAAPFVEGHFEDQRAELNARADAARAAISAAAEPEKAATVPEQAALDAKNDAISLIGALDDLAAALPDNSYATEITLEQGLVRLTGRTTDVPSVLTALESSGRFLDSRLVGTALRDADGTGSDFELETRPLIRTGGALR